MDIETLDELIAVLCDLAEQEDADGNRVGELQVLIATQPNWPLAECISAVTVANREGTRVWLAASPRYDLDYAPRTAWEGGVEGIDFDTDEDY